jgi:CheY-like chemotaxis protein
MDELKRFLVPLDQAAYNSLNTFLGWEGGHCVTEPLLHSGSDDRLMRAEHIIGALDKGIVVLSPDLVIRWANTFFRQWCAEDPLGQSLFNALATPEESRPKNDAFHAALAGASSCFRIPQGDRILDVTVSPISENGQIVELVALCDDVTASVLRQQKLNALHKAAQDLETLDADQLNEVNVSCRVEILKQNVRRLIHDVLKYNVIEIRLLEPKTGRLTPLHEEGMTSEAAGRDLYARTEGNGVTGFVAATKQPYLCSDTANDPYFIEGSAGARSSMTVPLLFNDEVIGTFNVESPVVNSFGPEDLQFTELFARELARALHTLNLLNAQEVCAASSIIDQVHRDIALPADDLIAMTSSLIQKYKDDPDSIEHFRKILGSVRKMKLAIRQIGGEVAKQASMLPDPSLDGMRILVVDSDERVRKSAHAILERRGCVVEASTTASEGIAMAKAGTFDAVLMAVKQTDMGGTAAYRAMRLASPLSRVILMQGFQYDPGHTLVNVKQDGYWLPVLFKPFQEPQLFKALTCPTPTLQKMNN